MNEVLTYETLKAECDAQQKRADALAVENAAMRSEILNITFMDDEVFFSCDQRAQELMGGLVNIKTPATDAALAAIEARGVEKFADFLDSPIDGQHCYQNEVGLARHFASTLREAK